MSPAALRLLAETFSHLVAILAGLAISAALFLIFAIGAGTAGWTRSSGSPALIVGMVGSGAVGGGFGVYRTIRDMTRPRARRPMGSPVTPRYPLYDRELDG